MKAKYWWLNPNSPFPSPHGTLSYLTQMRIRSLLHHWSSLTLHLADFPKTPLQQVEYPRSFPVALGSQEGVQQGSLPAHPPPDRWGDNSLLAGWVAKGGGEAHLHCHFHKHFRLPHSRRSAREIPCAWLPPPSLVALLSVQTLLQSECIFPTLGFSHAIARRIVLRLGYPELTPSPQALKMDLQHLTPSCWFSSLWTWTISWAKPSKTIFSRHSGWASFHYSTSVEKRH